MRSVVIYPEPGYLGAAFTEPVANNWHLPHKELVGQLKDAGYDVKIWPCEVDTQKDVGLAFDHPIYDCKIPDLALCVNLEPPVIRPRFFHRIHGWPYKRILTCARPYADDKKILWAPFPAVRNQTPLAKVRDKYRCAISSGNKNVTLPSDLYNHPDAMYGRRRQIYLAYGKNLDLYGWGWESDPEVMKATNFMGPVADKCFILSQYRIATVIENQVIQGYTTEKYWDAMQAGCVMDYTGSVPDYELEDALPVAWAGRIVEHLKSL